MKITVYGKCKHIVKTEKEGSQKQVYPKSAFTEVRLYYQDIKAFNLIATEIRLVVLLSLH